MKENNVPKRSLFAELMDGVDAMKSHREAKITLRTHTVSVPHFEESPEAEFFLAARKKFNVSRAVWANMLRVSPRTVEKWEQGGQVSPLASTFVELISRYPDTIERLQSLPRRVARQSNTRRSSRNAQTTAGKSGKNSSEGGPSGMRAIKAG